MPTGSATRGIDGKIGGEGNTLGEDNEAKDLSHTLKV